MFGSGTPDVATARARLRAITPRWVPTEADIDASAVTSVTEPDRPDVAGHSIPPAPRPAWRLEAGAVRGLVSLGLAAVAGALVVVVVGWPRGAVAPSAQPAQRAGESSLQKVLTQPSPSTSAAGVVVVDVDGAVRRPGVVKLAAGARVVDAIEEAGGVGPNADTGALNLAQVLLDGEQVVVPNAGEAPVAPGVAASPAPGVAPSTALINLNTATEVELETLPGIGPVLAAAIVEWRTQNGGFTSIDQLQDVSGIGPTTFADLAPLVRV